MNIIKNKKFIATALIFVMFMALVRPPLLPAKERRGSTVVVTMTDGRIFRGELLAVKADALLIYDYKGERIELQQVAQVKVLKKSKALLGFAIGYGVGLGSILVQKDSLILGTFRFILPIIPGLCGGLLGSIAGISEKLSLAGKSSKIVRKNLERLKRYAREQEFEKAVGN